MKVRRLDWKRVRFAVGILILAAIPLLGLSGCMWQDGWNAPGGTEVDPRERAATASTFDFAISVDPSSGAAAHGDRTTTTVRAWRTAGPATHVSFTISDLPTGVTVSPSSWRWRLGDRSRRVTFSIGDNAPVGTHTITIHGTGAGVTRTATFALTVTPQPGLGFVEGYVTMHLSGEAVSRARVVAYPLDGTSPTYEVTSDHSRPDKFTDETGFYRLVVPEGLYTVEVHKGGHAGSRVEGVKVGSTTRLDVVLQPVENPDWPRKPPTVTITGVTEGDTITGPVSVRIDAEGRNHIQHIYAAFGKMPGAALLTAPRVVASDTYTTGTITMAPADYGVSGDTTFEVVVYDFNMNRTHVIYRVFVAPGAVGAVSPPLAPIANILAPAGIPVLIGPETALAVTLGKRVAFFGLEPQAAPAGGNLYVELRWRRPPEDLAAVTGDGYRIYRRLATETDFRLLYTVNATGAATYIYRDSTPDLMVGLTAHYRITYFRGTAESLPLEASATPLPLWDVKPVSPADQETGVPLLPTFSWAPTATVGTTQFYQVVFWDRPLGDASGVLINALNATSATFTGIPGGGWERLQPHRVYQWEMRAALGIDTATANAVSVATNSGFTAVFPTQQPWEKFTFTTQDW